MQMPLFLSSFKDKRDFEVVATLCAWMSNGWPNEDKVIQKYISETMLPTPYRFIDECDSGMGTSISFFRMLTNKHLGNLINRLKYIFKKYGSLEKCFFDTLAYERKSKYNHDILAKMLSGGTGFQTSLSNCTFYRYNLLYYWLTYKFGIWERSRNEKALLPCNDAIFESAYKKKLIKVPMKSTLPNTKILSMKAKELYGEDFFKLYENLNVNSI